MESLAIGLPVSILKNREQGFLQANRLAKAADIDAMKAFSLPPKG